MALQNFSFVLQFSLMFIAYVLFFLSNPHFNLMYNNNSNNLSGISVLNFPNADENHGLFAQWGNAMQQQQQRFPPFLGDMQMNPNRNLLANYEFNSALEENQSDLQEENVSRKLSKKGKKKRNKTKTEEIETTSKENKSIGVGSENGNDGNSLRKQLAERQFPSDIRSKVRKELLELPSSKYNKNLCVHRRDCQIDAKNYPQLRRDAHGWNGTSDPFGWMDQQPEAELELRKFVGKLNMMTRDYVGWSPARNRIETTIQEMSLYSGAPVKVANKYFFFYNSDDFHDNGIYQQDSLNGPARLFLEWTQPNGWVDAPYDSFSSDGKIYAYLFHHFESGFLTSIKFRSAGGVDMAEDTIWNIDEPESITWLNAKPKRGEPIDGIFYPRFPRNGETGNWQSKNLYFHRIGTYPSQDVCVFSQSAKTTDLRIMSEMSRDGNHLIITVFDAKLKSVAMHYTDLRSINYQIDKLSNSWTPLFDNNEGAPPESIGYGTDSSWYFVDYDFKHWTALVWTNQKAYEGKVERISIGAGKLGGRKKVPAWTDIVPDSPKHRMMDVLVVGGGDRLLIHYLDGTFSTVFIHERETGRRLYKLPLGFGTLHDVRVEANGHEFFITFDTHLTALKVLHGNFRKCKHIDDPVPMTVYRQTAKSPVRGGGNQILFNDDEHDDREFVEKEVTYKSSDGNEAGL